MNILVTGGLGFIGSNFIIYVLESHPNIKITNVDAKLEGSNQANLRHIKKENYRFVHGNIMNQRLMDKLVTDSDVVFNFAAESHVDRSITDPKSFINSNTMGTFTILESIRKYKKSLVQISTDEVFGSLKTGSATEGYALNPSSPYSSSKASAELLVKSYVTTYGIDAIITRCTNNYGPRQAEEKLIPKVITLADKNKNIPVYGTGKNIRDWIFVKDHCDAVFKVFEKGIWGESYNIAGNSELDNNTVVKKILKIMGKPLSLINYVKDRPGHDFRYSLDSTRIQRQLFWRPKYKIEEGLEETISWYLGNKFLKHKK